MKVLVAIVLCLGAAAALSLNVLNSHDTTEYLDCYSLWLAGYSQNGTYTLTVNGVKTQGPCYFYVGYSRNIFLNRIDSQVSWDRRYADYIVGFGAPLHDYFGGLQNLHQMTKAGGVGLDIRFMDWNGNEFYYIYENFKVDSFFNGYKISIGGKTWGNTDGKLDNINGMTFHTKDYPDQYGKAKKFNSGWWFSNSVEAMPTGIFHDRNNCCPTQHQNGIIWGSYGYNFSFRRFAMSLVQKTCLATDQLLN